MPNRKNKRRKTKALPFYPALCRLAGLRDESDTTAAIVAATLLEGALEKAIASRMQRLSVPEHNLIFHGGGPLRNYRAKVLIARALGIFGAETLEEFETIASIRNEFAHSHCDVSFQSEKIEVLCAKLRRPEMRAVDFFGGPWGLHNQQPVADEELRSNPKLRYLKTTTTLLFLLESTETARPKRDRAPWPRFNS